MQSQRADLLQRVGVDRPADLPEHSLCTLLFSAYVHSGNADEARVEEMYQKWSTGG